MSQYQQLLNEFYHWQWSRLSLGQQL